MIAVVKDFARLFVLSFVLVACVDILRGWCQR